MAVASRAVPAGRPELPGDLEGDKGLAGAGGHREQHALVALEDGPHRPVDGDLLVVAGRSCQATAYGGPAARLPAVVGQFLGLTPAGKEFVGRGVAVDLALQAGGEIELDDAEAVSGVGELEAEDFGVFLGLLHALGGG